MSVDVERGQAASVAPPPKGDRQREERETSRGAWYPRWYWPSFAAPATIWLLVLFVLPFYVVVSVAFGTVDPIFQSPLPVYEPWYWSFYNARRVLGRIVGGHAYLQPVFARTFVYVIVAGLICLVLGYAVAYYVARYGGKRKTMLLVLLLSPFWVSYLMRMFAWVNLLQTDGYVNKLLSFLHLGSGHVNWLSGKPVTVILGLVYGYIPYMILPLYAFLDRIDQRLIEAGRDLGASPAQTFRRVTLPLSRPAILAGCIIVALPMFGDYYTNNLLSGSPHTTMIGNLLDDSIGSTGQGPQAAVLVLILMVILMVPMLYYLRSTARSVGER